MFHLDRAHVQTLMYLKLSVAGHLTIFLTRTRGPFWSIRPARILWIAVLGTQVLATLVAVYGADIMTPLGWGWALFTWGYALAWFLLNDRLKLLTYWILDSRKLKTTPKREVEVRALSRGRGHDIDEVPGQFGASNRTMNPRMRERRKRGEIADLKSSQMSFACARETSCPSKRFAPAPTHVPQLIGGACSQ